MPGLDTISCVSRFTSSVPTRRMSIENPYQPPETIDSVGQPPTSEVNWLELRTTRSGLFAVYYGICAILLGAGGGMIGGLIGGAMDMPFIAVSSVVLLLVGILGGSLSMLVGQIMCLTVPSRSGAKGFVQAAVGLQVFSFLLGVVGFVLAFYFVASPNPGGGPPIAMILSSNALALLNGVLGLVSFVCFLYFLRNTARFINRPDLEGSATSVLRLVATLVVLYFVVIGLMIFATIGLGASMGILMVILVLGVAILALVTFLKYANLVVYLARAIPTSAS